MEHLSKRRRVQREADRPTGDHILHRGKKRAGSLGDSSEDIKIVMPKLVLPRHGDQGFGIVESSRGEAEEFPEALQAAQIEPTKLDVRQLFPTQPNPAAAPTAIGNDQNIAPNSTAAPNPDNHPTRTGSDPGSVTPPPAVAASIARAAAQATQQAQAKELDLPPQAPSPSTAAAGQSSASKSPTTIAISNQVPGSSSQQVLSTPSSPVPSTPQPSASSSASYFSSSPASLTISNLPQTATPLAPSLTLGSNSQLPSSSNSTTSSTSSRSSTSLSSTSSVSSQASALTSSSNAQPTTSQPSSSNISALLASISATLSPSGFATSTRKSQTLASGTTTGVTSSQTAAQTTPLPTTTFATSASSQLSSQSSLISQSSASSSSGTSSAGVGVVGSGGPSTTSTAPSSTSSSAGGTSSSSTPGTPTLVGGIVGGVAGLVMLIALLLLLLRWRRGKTNRQRIISPPIPQTSDPEDVPRTGTGTMTERSSTAPIAAAGFFGRHRPTSAQTAATTETAPSERGFQKISGRKLPSVLTSGGDGYGDNRAAGPSTGPAGPTAQGPSPSLAPNQRLFAADLAPPTRPSPTHSLSGSSFYRDSQGFYGGVVPDNSQTETSGSPLSSSPPYPTPLAITSQSPARPPQGRGSPNRGEVANMRPGPARTPVINQPGFPMRTPSRATPPSRPMRGTPPPPADNPRDLLGRSHPSQDDSRSSRFHEQVTPP